MEPCYVLHLQPIPVQFYSGGLFVVVSGRLNSGTMLTFMVAPMVKLHWVAGRFDGEGMEPVMAQDQVGEAAPMDEELGRDLKLPTSFVREWETWLVTQQD